jgi:hypothetical protein
MIIASRWILLLLTTAPSNVSALIFLVGGAALAAFGIHFRKITKQATHDVCDILETVGSVSMVVCSQLQMELRGLGEKNSMKVDNFKLRNSKIFAP